MNADLTLAHLAEVAAAHDGHAHDGDRHCLLSGTVAVIHEAAAVPAEPPGAGVPARRAERDAHALVPGQASPAACTGRKPRR